MERGWPPGWRLGSIAIGRPWHEERRWLALAALVVLAALAAGCAGPEDGDQPAGAPHPVTYEAPVSPVQVTNGQASLANVSWQVPAHVEWRLVGSMQVFTDEARVIAVDEANVTNMTNASAGRLLVDRASFSVLDDQVWIDEGPPALELVAAEDLRLEGDLETPEYNGSGLVEGSGIELQAPQAPILSFASPSRVTVPERPPSQATGIAIGPGNGTRAPLEVDDERIAPPWEAWFTGLDARLPAEPGEPVRLEGDLVQVFRDGSPRFGCRLVLTDAEEPGQLGVVHVEGDGSASNATLVVERPEGRALQRTLDFLDVPATRPVHGQLLPGESYPVERPEQTPVEGWDVRAPNCAVDDQRTGAS